MRKIVILLAVNLLVFYLLSEIILSVLGLPKKYDFHSAPAQFQRVSDKEIVYVNKPSANIIFRYGNNPRGYFRKNNEVVHSTNKYGFRGLDFELNKAKDTYRVIILGDSFTFGEGVYFEDIFSQRMATRLKGQRQISNKKVEVINLGVGGYNTQQEWMLLKNFAAQLDPDFVILQFALNDAEPYLFYPFDDGLKRREREADAPMNYGDTGSAPLPIKVSRLNKLIWQIHQSKKTNDKLVSHYLNLYEDSNPDWQETKKIFAYLKKYSEGNNVPFLVVTFPLLYQLNDNYPFSIIHKKLTAELEKNHLNYIDLLSNLKNKRDRELWVYPTDQHPNEVVHRIAADEIVKKIAVYRK